MRLLKSFFSFTVPLVIMLTTFSIYLIVNKVVNNYKQTIINDYSIIVIANTPLVSIDSIADIKVKDIEILSREKIIEDIKSDLSTSSLDLLKNKLPYFYKIYLEEFPTTLKIEQIRKELTTISNIKRVETFASDHNKVYSLLILIQNIVIILFLVVLTLSIILLLKQVKIWFFEHSQRITIIQLHGGSLLYGSKPILKMMTLSAIFSILFVCTLLLLTVNNISSIIQPEILNLIPKVFQLEQEFVKIVILAFTIPLVTFLGLLINHKFK